MDSGAENAVGTFLASDNIAPNRYMSFSKNFGLPRVCAHSCGSKLHPVGIVSSVLFFVFLAALPSTLWAHIVLEISVRAADNSEPVVGASVSLPDVATGAVTDVNGIAQIDLHDMLLRQVDVQVSSLGFDKQDFELELAENLREGQIVKHSIKMQRTEVLTPEVQVVGRRLKRPREEDPVLVGETSYQMFEAIQAASIAEGLAFQPGLRLENNCQNCGFSQVRLNGLDGAYSQILIDSRPVFSALSGVYGLEQIPPAMIERIDVVRGGGSASQGANAIGGTINIITRDPVENSAQISSNTGLINGQAFDNTLTINAALTSETMPVGLHIFGFKRERDDWDANGDGFTEITALSSSSFGLRSYYKPSDMSRIDLEIHSIDEFRRGGNLLDRPAHQADIAEQLDHRTFGASLNAELYAERNTLLAAYTSVRNTHRDSYYGGGGNSDDPAERAEAANFYGVTDDFNIVGGLQAGRNLSFLDRPLNIALGTEWQFASVDDNMPGYSRLIKQDVSTLAAYSQMEWQPQQQLTVQLGLRHDWINLDGSYLFGGEDVIPADRNFSVLSPRVNILQRIGANWGVRVGFARGFRVPQAFDEDLHIETVGGTAQVVEFGDDLRPESSDSFTASLNFRRKDYGVVSWDATLEAFATFLHDPFINEFTGVTLAGSGASVVAKRNGDGARVAGVNIDVERSFTNSLSAQIGGTLQIAEYDAVGGEVVLEERGDGGELIREISSTEMLRTPNVYGFFSLMWAPSTQYDIALTGVFTGPMWTPNERSIELVRTPQFLEINIKTARRFTIGQDLNLELALGVQNALNSFQDDFDTGADRDSGYVYGPTRPRTYFGGLRLLW